MGRVSPPVLSKLEMSRLAFLLVLGRWLTCFVPRQDLMGIQLVHMVHPEDSARVTDAIRNALLYNNQVIQVCE